MYIPRGGYRQVDGAWIHPEAKIAEGAVIEPGALVGADVEVGAGSWVDPGTVNLAMTYIGNGPNFMVKAIAEKGGVKMPSFFGYMVYSILVLIPIFLVASFIFL